MISCNVREDYLVEASFEKQDKTDVSIAKHMQLRLLRVNGGHEEYVGSKSFPWPETKMPKQIRYVPEGDFVELRSSNNIAKVPLKLKDHIADAVGKHTTREPPVCLPQWNSPNTPERGLVSPLVAPTYELLNSKEPTPAQWKSLETAIASCPVVCPELCLTAADQEKLLALLLAKKNHERLLSNLIKRKVFGLPVADTLVNHLETSNNASEVQEFVTQCPNFPESAFVKVLKICASQSEKLGDSLLQTVLRKTYTRELLVSIVRTGLHTTAAVALINRLLPVVSDSDDSQLVDRAIELISVLVDSFSTQIILDEKHHSTITKAVELTSGLTTVLDSYAQLQKRLECNGMSADANNPDGDYVILSVVLTSDYQ